MGLYERIIGKTAVVAFVGLGYVGMPFRWDERGVG